jgi:hypothetical protein
VMVFVKDEAEGGAPGAGAENGDVHGAGGGDEEAVGEER